MKKLREINRLLLWLFFTVWCVSGKAQIPVEISVGHTGYYYQHSFAARFNPEKPLGFFHTSSVLIPYDKNRSNEIMSQSYVSYAINKNWTSGIGTIFTPINRVRLSAFIQYFQKWKTITVLIYPRIDIGLKPNLELMGFFEYQGAARKQLNPYARFQYMTTWNLSGHARSYQYARAGIGTADIQFGLAINFDQYGPMSTHYNNFGLFVQVVF